MPSVVILLLILFALSSYTEARGESLIFHYDLKHFEWMIQSAKQKNYIIWQLLLGRSIYSKRIRKDLPFNLVEHILLKEVPDIEHYIRGRKNSICFYYHWLKTWNIIQECSVIVMTMIINIFILKKIYSFFKPLYWINCSGWMKMIIFKHRFTVGFITWPEWYSRGPRLTSAKRTRPLCIGDLWE